MSPSLYAFLHVVSGFVLVGFTFRAFAHPTGSARGQILKITGIASVIMLVAGFGLLAKLQIDFAGWVIVKLLCWLALSAMAGITYRMPGKAGLLSQVTLGLVALAVYCVYYRPF